MDEASHHPRKRIHTTTLIVEGSIHYLLQMLDHNESRVLEILQTFTHETPLAIAQLRSLVEQHQWQAAAQVLHKLKTRFGYLGHDALVADLSEWENHLQHALAIEPAEELRCVGILEEMVAAFVEGLRKESLYQQLEKSALPHPLAGRTVLVVEDDSINAMVLEMFVTELAGTVVKVTDGYQAVRIAAELQPDLIFMDVHMPVFGGLDAIRAIRQQGMRCPIVSLSASTRLGEREKTLEAGADEFLIKPASREAIHKVLRKFLTAN